MKKSFYHQMKKEEVNKLEVIIIIENQEGRRNSYPRTKF